MLCPYYGDSIQNWHRVDCLVKCILTAKRSDQKQRETKCENLEDLLCQHLTTSSLK